MPSIRKHGTFQYQARVRLEGYLGATCTFRTRQEAFKWASERESLIR